MMQSSRLFFHQRLYHIISNSKWLPNHHANLKLLSSSSKNSNKKNEFPRLSKRMSELDLFSRRESDRLIADGKVFVRGERATLGQRVKFDETNITINNLEEEKDDILPAAVVLNKPLGYVSGQPEHGNVPAIRLLRLDNISEDATEKMDDELMNKIQHMQGYAPAGRLDRNSTGLLIFCRDGVIAKKLVSQEGLIEKEYIVGVEKAHVPSARERQNGLTRLPHPPSLDLEILNEGGAYLSGDDSRPLKPLVLSQWIIPGKELRIIMKEGRKHQIRRMMRELLGFHVHTLERIRIGPVFLKKKKKLLLPSGKWRPLDPTEIASILGKKT